MEVTQGIVLPVLLAAIIANTVILVIVVIAVRGGRDHITDTRSALEGGLMSTSFVDRSAQSEWTSNGRSDADGDAEANGTEGPVDAEDGSDGSLDGAPVSDHLAAGSASADATADDGDDLDEAGPSAKDGTDALTGLIDAAAFTRLVAAEDVRLQRYHRPATVVTFELAGLDRMIDRLGPDAADRVLPALADTMRRLARDVDYVARLAPGRFGVLLPETDEIAAINYVERVRRACELWLESGAIALTLAAGWAGSTGDPTLIEAMRLATDRMYVELRRDVRKTADY